MIDINFLENSWFFQIKTLKKWEVLFYEWDIDDNLYIIKKWELFIEKYTNSDHIETKILAKLWDNEIFWEWALWESAPKQVKIVANTDTILIYIEAKKSFEDFLQKHTKKGIELLSSIIYISNKRLLESNFLITSSYKINKYISEITEFNNRNLFNIIDELSKTIDSDYVIYIEKNPVINDILTIKYDTRKEWKMQQLIFESWNKELEANIILEQWIILDKHNHIEKLINWNEIIWYLVIWNATKKFNDAQKKSITTVSVGIAWFIKQKQYFEENFENSN